ncbi:MAG: phosphatase PAP2 family protein [Clostridia bacterium]|nr:phosphatase PAP2 family protein [Clostridia bacterium]
MALLKLLEGIRFPAGDSVFFAITYLGEEITFMALAIVVLWCINKRAGFYLLTVGGVGTVLSQWMKIVCRVPRPWVLDPEFTIVERARAGAGGYSFPSGHSQMSVGLFGGIALWWKKTWVRVTCIIICILVPFSRMYLGVHTPQDIAVGALCGLGAMLMLYSFFRDDRGHAVRICFAAITAFAVAFAVYMSVTAFPADIDLENLHEAEGNAFKLLGMAAGVWLSWEIDRKWLHFETKAVWWAQVLKTVLGLALVVGLKSLLKAPLLSVMAAGPADLIRYFVMAVAAGVLWPLTFRFFGKLGKKE